MAKTKKLKALKQTHAKQETYALTSLDQIWGFNEISRFGTIDENEYALRLRDMTRSDLENHARAVGAIVLEDNNRLKDTLMQQFRAYVLSIRKPVVKTPSTATPSEAYKRVMSEGK